MRLSRHAPFLAILAVAACLRLWGLAWLPSPAGDEGNWTTYGLQILRGQPAALDQNAAFVSLLYAHLIAGLMAVFGPGFFVSRVVNALAVLAAVIASYAVATRVAPRRSALVLAAVIAFHPWSIAYSRISSVPYGLAFAVETIGALGFLLGLETQRILVVAAGILVMSLGADFSPLTLVSPVACGVYALAPRHRWILRRWPTYAAVALGALHAWPIVRSALDVAGRTAPADRYANLFFWRRVGAHVHMVVTGLGGEATLRHFTSVALSPGLALIVAVPVLGFALATLSRRARASSPLAGFAIVLLAAGAVLTPLILAPGRDWDLPATHMDRYLFSLLPGFALCVAAVSAIPGRAAAAAVGCWLAWLAASDARMAGAFLLRDGVDQGEGVFDGGGGYRGWLVSDRPQAVAYQVRDEILQRVGPGGAALLVADRTFIPLTFVMDGTAIPVRNVVGTGMPRHPTDRFFILLWPDEVLALGSPPVAPGSYSTTDRGLNHAQRWRDRYRVVSERYVKNNGELRWRMQQRFGERTQLVRLFRQRGGGPLLELWMAEGPDAARLTYRTLGPSAP